MLSGNASDGRGRGGGRGPACAWDLTPLPALPGLVSLI